MYPRCGSRGASEGVRGAVASAAQGSARRYLSNIFEFSESYDAKYQAHGSSVPCAVPNAPGGALRFWRCLGDHGRGGGRFHFGVDELEGGVDALE